MEVLVLAVDSVRGDPSPCGVTRANNVVREREVPRKPWLSVEEVRQIMLSGLGSDNKESGRSHTRHRPHSVAVLVAHVAADL